MTVTVFLRCILLCLLITSVVRAETRVPTTPWQPPTSVLPPKELEPLLQEWDAAMAGDKFYHKGSVCSAVGGFIPKGQRFADAYFLRYSNPEIIDRVINHYLEVAANRAAGQWVASAEYRVASDASGEGNAEYIMFLAAMAESTFDPRIYEAVLTFLGGVAGDFWTVYLATVNPERTLDLLFESKLGPYPGKRGSQNFFYHHEIDLSIPLDDAYRILLLMVEQSPEALRTKRLEVLSFVGKYAKHYAVPQMRYKPEPEYLEWSDYWTRSRALDVMGVLGASTEVKLVEGIIEDAREVDLEYLRNTNKKLDRYEQIREKGQRIIKQIRGRSPSER